MMKQKEGMQRWADIWVIYSETVNRRVSSMYRDTQKTATLFKRFANLEGIKKASNKKESLQSVNS